MVLQLKYFRLYAEKFCLEPFIRYNKRVVNVTFAPDHEVTGRWSVKTEDLQSGEQETQIFDGVAVCTGHHVLPMMPSFPGQDKFRGKMIHTHEFKHASGLEGKRVVIVGMGNSGGDAAVEAASVASATFLSSRRGCWLRPRAGSWGFPFEVFIATNVANFLVSYTPMCVSNFILETIMNMNMDHETYGLKPGHRFLTQHPMINDALPHCILSGKVTMKRDIKEFTEDGVIFEGESHVTQVDQVIFATGYEWIIPFIDSSIIDLTNNKINLFKNMFQPNLPKAHTLALISLGQPSGPIHLMAEMQARWFARLMKGLLKLPSHLQMQEIMKEDQAAIKSIFYESPRHNLEVLYIPFMNTIASYIGCKPSITKYALKDPRLAYKLVFGLFTSYQFRLEGPFPWLGAREAIVKTNERIKAGFIENTPDIVIPGSRQE